jgi:hypothetical protein
MVEHDLAKVDTGVQFPSPAPVAKQTRMTGFFNTLIEGSFQIVFLSEIFYISHIDFMLVFFIIKL